MEESGRLKRIALYGGTFDPVHAGHMAVAENLSRLFALDEVLFIPAHVAPHKRERRVAPPLHRYAMLALATQHEARFRISTLELDAPEKPYTVETLGRFGELLEGSAQLFFVMGADSWAEITTWREWERVLSMSDHIVVTRPGYELTMAHVTPSVQSRVIDVRGADERRVGQRLDENSAGRKIYLTDAAVVDVASTEIRRAVSERGEDADLRAMLPEAVADYIKKYGLYRETDDTEFFDAGNEYASH